MAFSIERDIGPSSRSACEAGSSQSLRRGSRESSAPRFVFLALTVTALSAVADEEKSSVHVKKLPPLSFGLTGYAGADEARTDAQALQSFLTRKLGRDVTTRVFPSPAPPRITTGDRPDSIVSTSRRRSSS